MQSQSDPVMGDGLEFEVAPESAQSEFELAVLEPEVETSAPEPDFPAMASLEILKKAREERGESLNDIARTLKIAAHQLEALENGRFDVLPGPTFARGFLRNYARYLDVPPEPLLEGISARTPTTADLTSMLKLDGNVQPAASPRSPSKVLPVVLIALVVLALVGLVAAGIQKRWFNFRFELPTAASAYGKKIAQLPVSEKPVQLPVREKAAPLPMPEKPVQLPVHEEPVQLQAHEESVQPQAHEEPAPPPVHESPVQLKLVSTKLERPVPVNIAPESTRDPMSDPAAGGPTVPEVATLRLSFNASTLAQVRDSSGKLIFTRTGAKGNSSTIKGRPPFSIMVKQANHVKLEFNGETVDLKGHTSRDGIARLTLQ